MAKVFVTGGTGLVGIQLLLDLSRKGHEIIALKRPTTSLDHVAAIFRSRESETDLFSTIQWAEGDILDTGSLEAAMAGCDQVYHAAALVSFHGPDREALLKHNVEGTANVVNLTLDTGIPVLAYVSSTAAVGKATNSQEITEDAPWDKESEISNYAISKHYAEREVWRGSEEGLNVAIINPSVIIGPGKWGSSSTTLFDTVNQGLRFYSEGANGFVAVQDVSQALIRLVEEEVFGERFLVAGENLSYRTLFTWIAEALDKEPPSVRVTPWMSSLAWRLEWVRSRLTGNVPKVTKETAASAMRTMHYSSQKLLDALPGFSFTSVKEAVHQTAELYRELR